MLVGAGLLRRPKLTPVLRGHQLADNLGCFGCHGPAGSGGIANPGSDTETVPAWDGGNVMMYAKNEQEIREWILYGHPKRLMDSGAQQHAGDEGTHSHDPNGESGDDLISTLPLEMPAFEDVLTREELDDLVAYFKVMSSFDKLPSDAREGFRVARRLGCFGCHGQGGRVGTRNPRSFKGYIPPWEGADFQELVKNDDELRQWILRGRIDRFETNPVARFFTGRQVIKMPSYEGVVTDDELDQIATYIEWLNRDPENSNE